MTDTYAPPQDFAAKALVSSMADYEAIHKGSLADPEAFWAEAAKRYHWERPWDTVLSANLDIRQGPISVKWFAGATTNITVNCLDRHLSERGEKTALIWEGNDRESRSFTYRELFAEVCRCANALSALGIAKGDRVALYMPNVPELAIAVLAIARLGAVHVVVFGGFSAASLAQRLTDTKACALITADSVKRGTKSIPLKATADEALALA
ncbi:AMP-binding protein, partial [bacterium]|nr:AMP-binding protein [bacterium]